MSKKNINENWIQKWENKSNRSICIYHILMHKCVKDIVCSNNKITCSNKTLGSLSICKKCWEGLSDKVLSIA